MLSVQREVKCRKERESKLARRRRVGPARVIESADARFKLYSFHVKSLPNRVASLQEVARSDVSLSASCIAAPNCQRRTGLPLSIAEEIEGERQEGGRAAAINAAPVQKPLSRLENSSLSSSAAVNESNAQCTTQQKVAITTCTSLLQSEITSHHRRSAAPTERGQRRPPQRRGRGR